MNIHAEGNVTEDILEGSMPIHVACRLSNCPKCNGSGVSEYGYAAEGPLEAKDSVMCDRCYATGYILELDTAIRVEVSVVVAAYRKNVMT